jgi:hypothetical protein
MAEFFEASPEVPAERRKYLPRRRSEDIDVLKPGEPKDTEFGLILKDHGAAVGAVKMRYDADAEEFPLDGIVDAACEPVPWTTEQDESTQNPPVAFLSDDIRFTLGETRYNINLDQGNRSPSSGSRPASDQRRLGPCPRPPGGRGRVGKSRHCSDPQPTLLQLRQ